jgi:hypothetical protein
MDGSPTYYVGVLGRDLLYTGIGNHATVFMSFALGRSWYSVAWGKSVMVMPAYIASSATCEWSTPLGLYRELDNEFGFTLDPCASDGNAKCERYWTKCDDGLSKSWVSERVFMNPPYGVNGTHQRR